VGFSGGLDSTVLLHALATYYPQPIPIKAIHVHHGLSPNATDWQANCQTVCDLLGIPLIVCPVHVDPRANVEAAAREARYQAFYSVLDKNDCLVLAHHRDDQAETLLLQLFRGAGIDGMSAMPSIKELAQGDLLRPLLGLSRQALEAYAHEHDLQWVDDESNQESTFSRNYLRHQIIPLLEAKWPQVMANLSRTASHCQQARLNLDALAKMDSESLQVPQDQLSLLSVQHLDPARLANVLRVWLRQNQHQPPTESILHQLIDDVVLARGDATPLVQWGDTIVRRYQQMLYVMRQQEAVSIKACEWPLFPTSIALDGARLLQVSLHTEGLRMPEDAHIEVRFRQGGELFYWHGQTKILKKLLQEWNIPPWQRDHIPLVYVNGELAVVVGQAISDHYFAKGEAGLFQIEECRKNKTLF
jgi:tRNA(Ile)-lysidine synthase